MPGKSSATWRELINGRFLFIYISLAEKNYFSFSLQLSMIQLWMNNFLVYQKLFKTLNIFLSTIYAQQLINFPTLESNKKKKYNMITKKTF